MTTQCAWCSPTLDPNVSHGVCARCAGEVEARTWTPRMEREIAQILGSTTSGAQNAPDFDRLTPEESAAKADAVRAAWAETHAGVAKWEGSRHVNSEIAGSNPAPGTFTPVPPAPYVPRNRVDPVRVACYVGCALLLGVVWAQIARWAL